jgi:hypothetical protein
MALEDEHKKNLKLILIRWTLQFHVSQPRLLKTNSYVSTHMPNSRKFKLNSEVQ